MEAFGFEISQRGALCSISLEEDRAWQEVQIV